MNPLIFARIAGLVGCCALVACVNLTPPWEKHRDARPPESAGSSTLPVAEADAAVEDAATDQVPAIDAPGVEDAAAPAQSHDSAGERTSPGDAREAGTETQRDAGALSEDASDPDEDAGGRTDGLPALTDTDPVLLPLDAGSSPDTAVANLMKVTGVAFGTGPAYYTHPTATYDKAFDGDPTTFFDDSNASGGYTGIDGGSSTVVKFIRYYARESFNDRMLGGKFQCSPSSQTDGYVDLLTVTAVPPLAWTTVPVATAPACRFFRYLGPAESHSNLAEIEFWAEGGTTGTASFDESWVNLAQGRPASASSEQSWRPSADGNDGVLSTFFCPADGNFPDWYQVDLGAVHDIRQTGITVEDAASTYQYQIAVSLDGVQWTSTAAHLSGTVGGRATLTDDFQSQARYVRVTFSWVSNNMWGCLREFMVWGLASSSSDSGAESD